MIWFFEVPVWLIAMILLVVIGCLYEVGFFGLLSSILEVAIFIFALFCLVEVLLVIFVLVSTVFSIIKDGFSTALSVFEFEDFFYILFGTVFCGFIVYAYSGLAYDAYIYPNLTESSGEELVIENPDKEKISLWSLPEIKKTHSLITHEETSDGETYANSENGYITVYTGNNYQYLSLRVKYLSEEEEIEIYRDDKRAPCLESKEYQDETGDGQKYVTLIYYLDKCKELKIKFLSEDVPISDVYVYKSNY